MRLAGGGRGRRHAARLALASLAALLLAAPARAAVLQLSTDPFTNPTSQHQTEVEPDSFAFGNTVVAAFQVGRFFDGGSSSIGWATSSDGGATWRSGFLPALTRYSSPAGPLDRASDPSVAYDAVHGVWLVSVLGLEEATPDNITSILVSRSADGLAWTLPVTIAGSVGSFAHDKNWSVCDNGVDSPFRGHCYTSYSDFTNGSRIVTSTSLDGGRTWGTPVGALDSATGLGAQPVVQPSGRLVIPFRRSNGDQGALVSPDGGASFGSSITISPVTYRPPTAIRAMPLPSADTDGAGRIFVAWHDCRFRTGCTGAEPSAANDIVLSTSADGFTWTPPARVPIDSATSGVDHFVPGLGVDPQTKGAEARLGLAYYYFASTPCTVATCELDAGFVSSADGGTTWSAPRRLNSQAMSVSWLADTNQGRMVGDYISTSFVAGGTAVPVFALAGQADTTFHEAIFATAIPLAPPAPPAPPVSPAPQTPVPPPSTGSGPSPADGRTLQRALTLASSTRTVVYGGSITLSGTVSSGGAGESVLVAGLPPVLTTAGGSWSVTVRPSVSTTYQARWGETASAPVRVGVQPRVFVRLGRGVVAAGVSAARSFAGRTVSLQRLTRSGRWLTMGRLTLGRSSAATTSVRRLPLGSYRIRAMVAAQPRLGYLAGTSPVVRARL